MSTFFIALRSLIFAFGFVLLWGWVAMRVRSFDGQLGVAPPVWTVVPGVMVMVVGGILALTCVGIFVVRGRGTPAIFDAPRAFVVSGPYPYVRNPMYIGGWILLTGFGLYQRSTAILLFGLVCLLIAHLFVIFYEEPTLREKFGANYVDYCNAVPRWIPNW